MRKPLAAGIVVVGLLAAGCGSHAAQGHRGGPTPRPVLTTVLPAADRTPASSAAADAVFGASLYRELSAGSSGKNLVFSPVSISLALQMALEGARGKTATEMASVLHLSGQSTAQVAAAARALRTSLAPLARNRKELVAISNALWPQSGMPLQQPFRQLLGSGFGAAPQPLNFKDNPEAALAVINAAVSTATRGHISQLLPPHSIGPLTRLVLTNAVYLNAKWASPFPSSRTDAEPFTRADGSRTAVKMMRQQASFGYQDGAGFTTVRLPYVGGQLAMTVVLPDLGRLGTVETMLAKDGMAAFDSRLTPTSIDLSMPRFSFHSTVDLTPKLKAMGMHAAFSATADFSGITGNKDIAVSAVLHQAQIQVGEKGTEASAATAVILTALAAPGGPAIPAVDLDRPFLFAITDVPTGAPLFLGRVMDPAAG